MVESVNWTKGESSDGELAFYVGLSRLAIDSDLDTEVPSYIEYGSDSCDGDYCKDCEDAASNVISSVVVAFITCKRVDASCL